MVLVVWQLATGSRDFLPRLGAPIEDIVISPDQTLMALTLADNCVKIVNTRSRELEVLVEGPVFRNPVRTGLVQNPQNQGIAFGSTDGRLQFFSVGDDRSLGRLQVAPRNPVSVLNEQKVPESQVDFLTFSRNGDWLATVDRRSGAPTSALKFWAVSQSASTSRDNQPSYELNTQVMNAHSEKITSLAYHPTLDMCVTTAGDGKFKIWVVVEREEQQQQAQQGSATPLPAPPSDATRLADMCWACRSVGFYRDLEATAAAFSPDGSVLAVAYQHIITLWNPYNNTLLSTLTYPPPYEKIRRLAFLSSGSDLVAYSDFNLYAWDLLTSAVRWSQHMSVSTLTVDPLSPTRFAVVASPPNRQKLATVVEWESVDSPKPTMVWRSSHLIKAIMFQRIASPTPGAPKNKVGRKKAGLRSHLVYLNAFDEFFALEQVTSEQKEALSRKQKRTETVMIQTILEAQQRELNAKTLTEGPSVFKQIYGDPDTVLEMMDVDSDQQPSAVVMPKIKAKQKKMALSTSGDPATRKMVERFLAQLDAPSHALPPPSALFAQFAEALATKSDPDADTESAAKKPKTTAAAASASSAPSSEPIAPTGEMFNESRLLEKEASSGMFFMKEVFSLARSAEGPKRKLPESVAEVAVPESLLVRLGSVTLSDVVLPEDHPAVAAPKSGADGVKTPSKKNDKQAANVQTPTTKRKLSDPSTPAASPKAPAPTTPSQVKTPKQQAPPSTDKKRTKRKRQSTGDDDDDE
jgi:WD40 repeat protein